MNPKTHPKRKKIRDTLLANRLKPRTGRRSTLAISLTWLKATENQTTLWGTELIACQLSKGLKRWVAQWCRQTSEPLIKWIRIALLVYPLLWRLGHTRTKTNSSKSRHRQPSKKFWCTNLAPNREWTRWPKTRSTKWWCTIKGGKCKVHLAFNHSKCRSTPKTPWWTCIISTSSSITCNHFLKPSRRSQTTGSYSRDLAVLTT